MATRLAELGICVGVEKSMLRLGISPGRPSDLSFLARMHRAFSSPGGIDPVQQNDSLLRLTCKSAEAHHWPSNRGASLFDAKVGTLANLTVL